MDEPLTPVVIDGALHLLTPAQLLHHQSKAGSSKSEQQAQDELLAQQLTRRQPTTEQAS
jgi:hypothetical protein